ncbi:aminotransferase class IV [Nocardia sp. NPDC003979]
MRVERGGTVRGLSLHLTRLTRDCREVFATDIDTDLVRRLVRDAVGEVKEPMVARVTVFDPRLELGRPVAAADPQILVTSRKAPTTPLGPLSLQSAVYARDLPRVKHVGLFGSSINAGPPSLRASTMSCSPPRTV